MSLQLRHLRHAVVLAEKRTYTRAARALHLSQPALSRSIQSLENLLGVALFDRTASGVEPTAIGHLFLERARRVLADASDLEREIQLAVGLEIGTLAVGAAPYPAEISVGTACGRLSARHPGLKLDVRVGDWQFLTQLVLAGEIDVAVAELSVAQDEDRLETEPLPRHRGALICRAGHPLAGEAEVRLEDALAYPMVTSSLPERMARLSSSIRVDTFDLVRSVVLESNAVGLALPSQVTSDLDAGRLICLPIVLPWLHTNYGFIRLRHRTPSRAATAFMESVRAVETEIAGTES